MCLQIESKYHRTREPLIAGYNILAYKKFYSDGNNLRSPYYNHLYRYNKLYSARIGYVIHNRDNLIGAGLHASLSRHAARQHGGKLVHQVIIPMGARFFIGTNRDIVANKMLILEHDLDTDTVEKADFSKHVIDPNYKIAASSTYDID